MFILPRQDIQQGSPQIGILAEPVKDFTIEQPGVQESSSGTVQAVLPVLAITKPVWPLQWTVPWVPDGAVGIFHMQVDGDFANVVQQRRIGGGRGPGLRLGGLGLRSCTGRQQVGLPQFECIGDDFQAVVEHSARIGVVMPLGGWELLDQFSVAFQGCQIQSVELTTR